MLLQLTKTVLTLDNIYISKSQQTKSTQCWLNKSKKKVTWFKECEVKVLKKCCIL